MEVRTVTFTQVSPHALPVNDRDYMHTFSVAHPEFEQSAGIQWVLGSLGLSTIHRQVEAVNLGEMWCMKSDCPVYFLRFDPLDPYSSERS